MSSSWRFIDSGSKRAAYNMAVNKVIVESINQKTAPNTFLFSNFHPTVLVGYHQSVSLEIKEDYCRENGIDINRRITGGGAIYMGEDQLGWEIFALKDTPGIPSKIEELYPLMSESAILGLKKFGIEAKYRPKNDIEVEGRKISGTGGMEVGDAFLFHASLLIDFDVDTMMKCLHQPVQKLQNKQLDSFKQRVTSMREILGYVPPLEKVKEALAQGFAEVLGITLEPGILSPGENMLLDKYLPMFESDEWVYGKRVINRDVSSSAVDYKTEGGLIRVNLGLDVEREIIKDIFITGDFFAYPSRSILDLEAGLKNASCLPQDVKNNVTKFFAENTTTIPGVIPEDFISAVLMAIDQAKAASC